MERSGGKEGWRDCSRVVDWVEGSLLGGRLSTRPLASTLTGTIKKTDREHAQKLGRTVSGILGFEPCSSGRDREVVYRGGSYPVGRSSVVRQPMYSVCCWGLTVDSRSVDRLVFVLGVERNLGSEIQ